MKKSYKLKYNILKIIDDQWLLGFLRGCKYSLERTKEKLDLYYTVRTAVPELCGIYDPMDPKAQELLSLGYSMLRYLFRVIIIYSHEKNKSIFY